ncbi:MAG: arginine--tRNA ligase [Bacilli bacterium]|nr:arginine--tRNA ligase [Bacilli bacterium]
MSSFIAKQEEYIKNKIKECGYDVDEVVLNVSSRKEFGDYQYNGAMSLAKQYGKNPRDIATEIVESIKKDDKYKDINIAGPGFINITFSDKELIEHVNELNENINLNYETENPKTIFMDYGGANVAKALHVGHLRSANIGEALKRLVVALGNKAIADTHLGDWGRPIGLVMTEIKHRFPELPYFDENYQGEYPKESPVTNDDLMEIYPLASEKAKNDEEYMEEARDITSKFQLGDKGLMALWNHIMDVSKADIKRVYDRLNVTFETWEGESDCYKYIPETVEYLEKKGLIEESQGAKIINVSEPDDDHEVPPVLLIKSNGAASYESTDVACLWERMHLFNPDEIWYLTDARQALHFEQVFRAAYKSGIVPKTTNLEFIPFGTMNGADGKPFKTRDGGVMTLEALLDMAKVECEKKILPNITGKEREEIAEKISVAAVKYADLIPYRLTDYNFDPIKFSDLQGKTAPYLLYSTIRMKSLLNKAEEAKIAFKEYKVIKDDVDREVIIGLLNLRSVLLKSFNTRSLNDITDFLYKITNLYNNFYSQNRVLTEENSDLQESWLFLTKVIYENNLKLLNILGIEVPERM